MPVINLRQCCEVTTGIDTTIIFVFLLNFWGIIFKNLFSIDNMMTSSLSFFVLVHLMLYKNEEESP